MSDTNSELEELEADVMYHIKKLLTAYRDASVNVSVQEKSLQRIGDLESKLSKAHKQHSRDVNIMHKRCSHFEESYRATLHSKKKCMKLSHDKRKAWIHISMHAFVSLSSCCFLAVVFSGFIEVIASV